MRTITLKNNNNSLYLTRRLYSSKINNVSLVNSLNTHPVFDKPLEVKDKKGIYKVSVYLNEESYVNIESFKQSIANQIVFGKLYTCFIKIKLENGSYYMAGNQFSFVYSFENNLLDLHQIIGIKINEIFNQYSLDQSNLDYLHITFMSVSQVLVSEFKMDENKNPLINTRKDLKIPISVNPDYLNSELEKNLDSNGNLMSISTVINGVTKIITLNLPKDKNEKINLMDYSFYYMAYSVPFILGVKVINSEKIHKVRFTVAGTFINDVTDEVVGDHILRSVKDKLIYIKDDLIIKSEIMVPFKAIKPNIKSKESFIPNPNIGVIDLETYLDVNGIPGVYSAGFITNLEENPITYYIDKNLNSNFLITSLIDEMLRSKYNNHIFYCHNLGGYDIVFILNALLTYNQENKGSDAHPYVIDAILRDDKVIKVTISKKVNSVNRKLVILDSYAMLTSSLSDLCKSLDTKIRKGSFPYLFATKDNLFYCGVKPAITYYKDIDENTYKKISKTNWDFKKETLLYLESDLKSLYECLVKANRQIFNDFDINMTDSVTISGLALKIFLKDFYSLNIPHINKASIYNDIKKAYYGGITEVYKPSNIDTKEVLYYYDVNSLYPFAALATMTGTKAIKANYFKGICLKDLSK